MPEATPWYDRLTPEARRQLDAFTEAVDSTSELDLVPLLARPLDAAAHQRAVDEAARVAAERGRPTLMAEIRATAGDWLIRANSGRALSVLVGGPLQQPGDLSVRDRLQTVSSLSDALLAIALWDALDDTTKDELLGPWVQFVSDE